MNVWSKVKVGAAVVVGVPIVGLVGYAGLDDYMNGKGEIHVQAPMDSGVTVFVDGDETAQLKPGQHQKLALEQGERAVKLVTDRGGEITHDLKIESGFFEALLPASKQCFAELDVYDTYYTSEQPPPMPDVDATYSDGSPIDVSSTMHFAEAALPSTVQEGSTVQLLLEIPCELAGEGEEEVRVALGYTPDAMSAR